MRTLHFIRSLALALTGVVCASCAGSSAESAATGTGTGTGNVGGGCQTSACVSPLSTSVKWEIEIDPSSSGSAAPTELTRVAIGGGERLTLTADATAPVMTSFSAATGTVVPSTAYVVLSLTPLIGGRPNLIFEAAALGAASGATGATLQVPAVAVATADAPGRTATLQLIPLSPADQQSPPASFSTAVATILSETLPANTLPISGSVLSALGMPPSATFIARAFLPSGTQISNAPQTGSDGSFALQLAPEAAGAQVTVELTPLNQAGTDPWYTSSALDPTMNRTLAPIMLPPYSSPNVFALTVHSLSDAPNPVGGALVRAQAIIGSNAAGTTDFEAAGTTTAPTATGGGTVTLSLLPGTANTALPYDLTVIPPASSPYATRCLQAVGVTVGGTANAPSNLISIALTPRPILTGRVTDALGNAVPSVAVTATAGPAPTAGCTNTPGVSSSTLADAGGNFTLHLDVGTYQLDYDPPAGAPVPRLTETVEVDYPTVGDGLTTIHDVTLPPAASVTGLVYGPDTVTPLASATVRIFRLLCVGQDDCFGPTRTAPELLAQTVTDMYGNFQAVVPANAPSD